MKTIKNFTLLTFMNIFVLFQTGTICSMDLQFPPEKIDYNEFDLLATEFIEETDTQEHKKKYVYILSELLTNEQKKLQAKENELQEENTQLKEKLKHHVYVQNAVNTIITYLESEDTDDLPAYFENISLDARCSIINVFAKHPKAHELILKNNCSGIEIFIKYGLDMNAPDQNGNTLALLAGKDRDSYSLKRLINAGADMTCKNKKGRTPLQAYFEKRIAQKETLDPFLLKKYIEMRIEYRTNAWIQEYNNLKNDKNPDVSKIPFYIRTEYDYKNAPKIAIKFASQKNNLYPNGNDISAFVNYDKENNSIIFWYNDKQTITFEKFLHTLEHEITHITQLYNSFALKKMFSASYKKSLKEMYRKKTSSSVGQFDYICRVGLPDKLANEYFFNINKVTSWNKHKLSQKEINEIFVTSETEADIYGIKYHPFPQEYYHELINITKNNSLSRNARKGYVPFEEQKSILLIYFKSIKTN